MMPLILVSFAQFLAMLIWFNFSAVLPFVQAEWHLTTGQSGLILSSFQLGYVVSVLIFGFLSDQMNPRHIFIVSSLIAGVSGLLFGLYASGFWSAFIYRTLAGIGLGGVYVPGMKYLVNIYATTIRGKIFGIYVGALVVGSGSSLLLAAPLNAYLGWREVIIVTSLGAFISSLLMIVYRYDPHPKEKTSPFSWALLRKVILRRPLIAVNAAYAGHMWELYAFWGWIGPFMIFTAMNQGSSIQEAQQFGNFWGGLFIVIGALGTWLGGKLSDTWGRVNMLRPLLAIGLVCSLIYGWLSFAPLYVVIIIGLVYGMTVVGDSPIYSAAASELSEEATVGFSLAIQQVVGYSITIVSPAMFGVMLSLFSNEVVAWGSAFAMLSLGSLFSLYILPKINAVYDQSIQFNRNKKKLL